MSINAPCPLCGGFIDPMSFRFVCPACKTAHDAFSFMSICSYCKFGPNYIPCPHCNREFELMLLLGNFKNQRGDTLPPQVKRAYDDKFSFTLQQLDPGASAAASEALETFPPAGLLQFVETPVRFPFPVVHASIHAAHASVDGRYWIHFHVYSANKEETKPFGQVTLVLDSRGNSIECPVKEIFFHPG